MTKRISLLCCLLVVMLILVGCGKEEPVETTSVGGNTVPVTTTMTLEVSNRLNSFTLNDNALTLLPYGSDTAFSLSGLDDVAGRPLSVGFIFPNTIGLQLIEGMAFSFYNVSLHSGRTIENNDITLAAANGGMWGSLAIQEVSRSDGELVALGTDERGTQTLLVVRPVEQGVLVFDCVHILVGTVMSPLLEE